MMTENQIKDLVNKQKEFYQKGETLSVEFRINQLKKLYDLIKENQYRISNALKSDLGKSETESFMCEIGLVLSEITHMLKNIKKYAKSKRVKTPISQFAAKSFVKPVPYGNVLIVSPWNYPLLLTVLPLVDAIAAGNTVIIKPAAYSPAVSEVIKKIISKEFDESYIAVITGGREENSALFKQKFDFIFFTGSQNVGREVLKSAAENLTPVVLELGGKSPCIVDETADIPLAAKRIVFGKLLNCGQTCVAPDYILCDAKVRDTFISEAVKQIKLQYGKEPIKNNDYGRIINEKHFDRLMNLIDDKKVVYGGLGDKEKLKIEPTVMKDISFDDKVMREEIFGPIMPVIDFEDFDNMIKMLKSKEKPLALYIFSKNKEHINKVINNLSFGGGCINDTVIHLATCEMGFGGVGESGMGAYHGKIGFDTFSHQKSIVDKKNFIDMPIRYQPYNSKFYKKLLRLFLR